MLGEGELGVCGALGHRASRPDLLLPLALAVPRTKSTHSIQPVAVCAVGGTLLGEGELGVCGALGHRASRPDLLLPLALAVPLSALAPAPGTGTLPLPCLPLLSSKFVRCPRKRTTSVCESDQLRTNKWAMVQLGLQNRTCVLTR